MYSDYGLLHWSSCLCKFNKLNAPFSYEAVCYWNCSVISQRSCSEAPDKLRVRQGSVHQHGGQWDVASLFVHWGSLLLCAASSRAGSLSPAPRLSVRFYFAPRLSLLTVCAFFIFFHLPEHFSLSLSMFLFITPSLCSFPSLSVHLHLAPPLCHLYLSDSARVNSPSHPPTPAFAVLLRPTEAIRTDGLRWFPGSTHFYRKQPGTAAGMMLSRGVRRSNNIIIQSAKGLKEFWHYV